MKSKHQSVLLQEVIEGLQVKEGEIFLDGTVGNAGHTQAVCEQAGDIICIGIDADASAVEIARENAPKCKIVQGNFVDAPKIIENLGFDHVDKVLLDLGWRTDQLESGRGFSFQKDEPLLMTYGDPKEARLTAKDIVNSWDEENIKLILSVYGEERYSGRIARTIAQARRNQPIETTFDLVRLIKSATPLAYHHKKIHPATRTFQALRIAVNDELVTLEKSLKSIWPKISKGGRMAVISFHSLEDRIVKRYFRDLTKEKQGTLLNKKPITASQEELKNNPKSRSAKLRIIEK